jgi:hypothetical protein
MYKSLQLPHLIRLVLAWFVLTLTVAVASPFVTHQSFDLICTGSGLVKLAHADADDNSNTHALDCPACLPGLSPTAHHRVDLQAHHLKDVWLEGRWLSAHLTPMHRPFAPRGPPGFSI